MAHGQPEVTGVLLSRHNSNRSMLCRNWRPKKNALSSMSPRPHFSGFGFLTETDSLKRIEDAGGDVDEVGTDSLQVARI